MSEDGVYGLSKPAGELLERWPKGADGESVPPVLLTTCSSVDIQDELLANMLEAFGIPVMRRYVGDGMLGKIVIGISGTGTELYVPETMYEDAKAIMEAKPDDELQD